MAADALPAPITIILPRGAAGMKRGTQSAGCADAMAASKIWRKKTRGAGGEEVLIANRTLGQSAGGEWTAGDNVLVKRPMPSIQTSTSTPSRIDPTPKDVPQAITSPGNKVMSWEIR